MISGTFTFWSNQTNWMSQFGLWYTYIKSKSNFGSISQLAGIIYAAIVTTVAETCAVIQLSMVMGGRNGHWLLKRRTCSNWPHHPKVLALAAKCLHTELKSTLDWKKRIVLMKMRLIFFLLPSMSFRVCHCATGLLGVANISDQWRSSGPLASHPSCKRDFLSHLLN